MKKLLFLLLLFPMAVMAQFDFEQNKMKLDFVKLPRVESLLSSPLPTENFSKLALGRLPSFKLNKNNYREPVSMLEATIASEQSMDSNIKISIDPSEYRVFGDSKAYQADSSTQVRNAVYEDVSQPFLLTDRYYRNPYRVGRFGISGGYYPYRYR